MTERDRLAENLRLIRKLAEESLDLLTPGATASTQVGEPNLQKGPGVHLDFGTPIRPFIKTHGKDLGGSKKLVLLLAWIAKGDTEKQVSLSEIEKRWGQMTGILGTEFNRFFAGDAKDHDWIEARSKGLYNLRPSWREVLKHKRNERE